MIVLAQREDEMAVGPVYAGGGRTANGQPIEVGTPFSFGYLLRTEGKEPALLERIRVLGVTGPVEVLGVMARPHPSGPKPFFFMAAFGFPPSEYPSKSLAEEHVVPVPTTFSESGSPYEGLQLIVGVKPTGMGVGRIRGIEFTYRVGDRRYRNRYEGQGFLCAPAAEYVHTGARFGECPGNLDDYEWDKKSVDFHVRPDGGR